MGTTLCWNLTLSEVERFLCFAAMPLAIAWDGACVCWLRSAGVTMPTGGVQSPNLIEQGTTSTLPQCSLLGALLVLFYHVSAMLVPAQSWGRAGAQSNRRAFMPLWRSMVAPGALQSRAPYMDHFMMGVD